MSCGEFDVVIVLTVGLMRGEDMWVELLILFVLCELLIVVHLVVIEPICFTG